jgi:hypothetical protein
MSNGPGSGRTRSVTRVGGAVLACRFETSAVSEVSGNTLLDPPGARRKSAEVGSAALI